MSNQDQNLEFILRFKNEAEATLKAAGVNLNQLGKHAAEAGARMKRMEGDMRSVKQAAEGAADTLGKLKGAMAALGVGLGGRELVRASESFAMVQARVKLATKSTEEFTDTMARLMESSNRTGTELEAATQTFLAFQRGADRLGASSAQIVQTVEIIQKLAAVSGASGAALSGAMTQFGQGIASGTLRGEELNSVLEQFPALAKAIADGMGAAVGDLKSLAEQGKITGGAIMEGLLKQREAVDAQFAQMPPRITAALTAVGNEFTKFVNHMDTAHDVSKDLSSGLLNVAENMDTVGRAVAGVIVGLGALSAVRSLPALFAAMGGPWGIAVGALAAGIGVLAFQQSDAEKAAADHAKALDILGTSAASAQRRIEALGRTESERATRSVQAQLKAAKENESKARRGFAMDSISSTMGEGLTIQGNKTAMREVQAAKDALVKDGFTDEGINAYIAKLNEIAKKYPKLTEMVDKFAGEHDTAFKQAKSDATRLQELWDGLTGAITGAGNAAEQFKAKVSVPADVMTSLMEAARKARTEAATVGMSEAAKARQNAIERIREGNKDNDTGVTPTWEELVARPEAKDPKSQLGKAIAQMDTTATELEIKSRKELTFQIDQDVRKYQQEAQAATTSARERAKLSAQFAVENAYRATGIKDAAVWRDEAARAGAAATSAYDAAQSYELSRAQRNTKGEIADMRNLAVAWGLGDAAVMKQTATLDANKAAREGNWSEAQRQAQEQINILQLVAQAHSDGAKSLDEAGRKQAQQVELLAAEKTGQQAVIDAVKQRQAADDASRAVTAAAALATGAEKDELLKLAESLRNVAIETQKATDATARWKEAQSLVAQMNPATAVQQSKDQIGTLAAANPNLTGDMQAAWMRGQARSAMGGGSTPQQAMEEFERQQAAIEEWGKAAGLSLDEVTRKQQDAYITMLQGQTDWLSGVKLGWAEYVKESSNAATEAASLVRSATKGMEDMFTKFFTGQVRSWSDFTKLVSNFASMIAAEMVKVAIVKPMVAGFMGAIGMASAKGNVFAAGNVVPFAQGGAFTNSVVSNPTTAPMALFGEAGPEAIMPLGRDASGNLGVRMLGETTSQSGTTIVWQPTYEITVSGGGAAGGGEGGGGVEGEQWVGLLRMLDGRVRTICAEFFQEQRRPGGMMTSGKTV